MIILTWVKWITQIVSNFSVESLVERFKSKIEYTLRRVDDQSGCEIWYRKAQMHQGWLFDSRPKPCHVLVHCYVFVCSNMNISYPNKLLAPLNFLRDTNYTVCAYYHSISLETTFSQLQATLKNKCCKHPPRTARLLREHSNRTGPTNCVCWLNGFTERIRRKTTQR